MDSQTEYMKVASYEAKPENVNRCLLLYSGGLDTSVMIKWIKEHYDAEVVALTLDIGQQGDDLEEIKQRALDLGAVEALVVDAKDDYAENFIAKGILANARYQGDYHLSTPIGRALIAKVAVEAARDTGADCIAHGCTGKGNDQARIESYILTLSPETKIMAPVREWKMGRSEEIAYAEKHGIPAPASVDFPYSVDDNMWGMTWQGGEIEEPHLIAPVDKFLTTYTLPQNAPDEYEDVTISFEKGLPVKVNGDGAKLAELIKKLNGIAGGHGVGVAHIVEDRLMGLKDRGIYEQPGGHAIILAHHALERYVSTKTINEIKEGLDSKWGYLCYSALWYDPAMDAINAFNEEVNKRVTGDVTLRLFKGRADVVALTSPFGLEYASFTSTGGYDFNVNASAAFTEIHSLQMRLAAQKKA